jgi:selenocysteine-specific elongation factor
VHGQSVDSAGWGQRVAMNLTGPERASIERGQVICHEKLALISDRFDAFLEVRPAATKGIKNHQRVRIHMGAAERLGKIVLLGAKEKADPKESVYCQITLEEPLLALRNDHFIVRDETARRTLAGGTVIHPWAKRHKRNEADLTARLEALHKGGPLQLTETFLNESPAFASSIEAINQFLNLREEETRQKVETMKSLRALNAEGEKAYSTARKWERLKEQIVNSLKDFHAGHPLVPGMDMEELRGKLMFELSPKIFRAVVDTLINDKAIAKEDNLLRLASHKLQLGGQEKTLMDKIRKILAEQPLAPPDLKEIEKLAAVARSKLMEVLRLLERDGSVVRVTTDMYFATSAVDQLRVTSS